MNRVLLIFYVQLKVQLKESKQNADSQVVQVKRTFCSQIHFSRGHQPWCWSRKLSSHQRPSLVIKVLARIREAQESENRCCSPVQQRVRHLQSSRRQTSPLTITPTTNRRVEEISNRVLVILPHTLTQLVCRMTCKIIYTTVYQHFFLQNVVQEAILQCQEKERSEVKKLREKLKQKVDECCELETQLLVGLKLSIYCPHHA